MKLRYVVTTLALADIISTCKAQPEPDLPPTGMLARGPMPPPEEGYPTTMLPEEGAYLPPAGMLARPMPSPEEGYPTTMLPEYGEDIPPAGMLARPMPPPHHHTGAMPAIHPGFPPMEEHYPMTLPEYGGRPAAGSHDEMLNPGGVAEIIYGDGRDQWLENEDGTIPTTYPSWGPPPGEHAHGIHPRGMARGMIRTSTEEEEES